jgi:hypothetical protein
VHGRRASDKIECSSPRAARIIFKHTMPQRLTDQRAYSSTVSAPEFRYDGLSRRSADPSATTGMVIGGVSHWLK